MTVQTTSSKAGPYSGNGVTTSWQMGFRVDDAADLQVIYSNADGIETILNPAQYSVADIGAATGATVTYPLAGAPLGAAEKVTLLRVVDYDQRTSITNQGGFYPEVLERAIDRVVYQCQQLAEKLSRAVTVSVSGGIDPSAVLASISTNATLALNSATAAATSEAEAATAASDAGASAAAAAASAASIGFPIPNTSISGLGTASTKDTGAAAGNVPLLDTDAKLNPAIAGFNVGQCYLTKSGANLVLQPYNGNQLFVNGAFRTIPAPGLSLAPTGLTANVTYYIYAAMNGPSLTLEASTTAWAVDGATGISIKNGDATRTLVGMARPIAGPAWMDTAAQRFVKSWFNRQVKPACATPAQAGISINWAILANSICEFLVWGGDTVFAQYSAQLSAGGSVAVRFALGIGLDGSQSTSISAYAPGSSGLYTAVTTPTLYSSLSEGYHYTAGYGWIGSGSGQADGQTNIVHLVG